jgi:hypothetical protein
MTGTTCKEKPKCKEPPKYPIRFTLDDGVTGENAQRFNKKKAANAAEKAAKKAAANAARTKNENGNAAGNAAGKGKEKENGNAAENATGNGNGKGNNVDPLRNLTLQDTDDDNLSQIAVAIAELEQDEQVGGASELNECLIESIMFKTSYTAEYPDKKEIPEPEKEKLINESKETAKFLYKEQYFELPEKIAQLLIQEGKYKYYITTISELTITLDEQRDINANQELIDKLLKLFIEDTNTATATEFPSDFTEEQLNDVCLNLFKISAINLHSKRKPTDTIFFFNGEDEFKFYIIFCKNIGKDIEDKINNLSELIKLIQTTKKTEFTEILQTLPNQTIIETTIDFYYSLFTIKLISTALIIAMELKFNKNCEKVEVLDQGGGGKLAQNHVNAITMNLINDLNFFSNFFII